MTRSIVEEWGLLVKWPPNNDAHRGPRRDDRRTLRPTGRGEYGSNRVQEIVNDRITRSMSYRGNWWDNACVESFFGTLKRELIHHRQYHTRDEAMQEIFDYPEVFCNRQRRHSTLGHRSPAEYEALVAVA